MKEGMGRLPGAGGAPSGGLSPATLLPLVRDSAPARGTALLSEFMLCKGMTGPQHQTKSTAWLASLPSLLSVSLAAFWAEADAIVGKRFWCTRHTWDILWRGATAQQLGSSARRAGDRLLLGEIQQDTAWYNCPTLAPAPVDSRRQFDHQCKTLLTCCKYESLTQHRCYSQKQALWVHAAGSHLPCRSLPPGKTSSKRTSHASS